MINIIDCDRNEFLTRIKNKKVYCFGAGKYFVDFLRNGYDISIVGVIDNYCDFSRKFQDINGGFIKVISLDSFRKLYDKSCIVLITTLYFEDIIKQLDSIKEFNDMDCYIDSYIQKYSQGEKFEGNTEKINRPRGIGRKQKNYTSKGRFQIWEYREKTNMAGSKAPADIKDILEKMGYMSIGIHSFDETREDVKQTWRYQRCWEEWKKTYDSISENAILVLQVPFCQKQNLRNEILQKLKIEKNVRIISIVHDVEQLRGIFLNKYTQSEFEFILRISDIMIVHNKIMFNYFTDLGVPKTRLISLDIFDYLYHGAITQKMFEKSIVIAGNMDGQKSSYIGKLGKLSPMNVHLYGPNYNGQATENTIFYHGSFPSSEIPGILDRGFGLIWDGDSLDTCSGATGEYLRYNNPHKLSLYLAAGLPVIIWKEAAEADFVEKHGLGFRVSSLYEVQEILNDLDESMYTYYLNQVQRISARLAAGEYTSLAIKKAEDILNTEGNLKYMKLV